MQLVFTPRISNQVSLEPMFAVMGCHMNCKTNQIRAAWHAGDRIGALRIAARFFDRSIDTVTFKRGMSAHNHPGFYRQLGQDPARPRELPQFERIDLAHGHAGGEQRS